MADKKPTLLVYLREDGRTWAWHLKAENGRIIATDGGQGYENEKAAWRMADAIVIDGKYKDADRRSRRDRASDGT